MCNPGDQREGGDMIVRYAKNILVIVLVLMLVAVVGFIGTSIYANCAVFNKATLGSVDTSPSIEDARYSLKIVNTGRVIYTDEYAKDGLVYILPYYWERVDGKYVHRPGELRLDEAVFGPVLVKRR